jgi:putative flippase GtrA
VNDNLPPELPRSRIAHILRQMLAFFGVGVAAAIVHYGLLLGLVEIYFYDPVSATLAGYVMGGIVSYGLNRAYTYDAERSHLEAGWRFGVVAAIGFGLTWLLMALFTRMIGWHYLASQILTTGIVLVWSFAAHKYWSFRDRS